MHSAHMSLDLARPDTRDFLTPPTPAPVPPPPVLFYFKHKEELGPAHRDSLSPPSLDPRLSGLPPSHTSLQRTRMQWRKFLLAASGSLGCSQGGLQSFLEWKQPSWKGPQAPRDRSRDHTCWGVRGLVQPAEPSTATPLPSSDTEPGDEHDLWNSWCESESSAHSEGRCQLVPVPELERPRGAGCHPSLGDSKPVVLQ